MAVATTTLIVAGLALAAVGTAGQFIASSQAASAQKKSAKEEQRAAKLQASRQRRQEIRQARIARGQTLNVAGQVGAQGSGLSGGLASIGAQAGANLGFSTQTQAIGKKIAGFGRDIASAQRFGAIAGGIANLGGALFSSAGALGRPPAAPQFSPLPVARPF